VGITCVYVSIVQADLVVTQSFHHQACMDALAWR